MLQPRLRHLISMLEPTTLNSVIRSSSFLAVGDTVYRAIEMLRDSVVDTVPVLDSYERLQGVISARDLTPLLAGTGTERTDTDAALIEPITQWMRRPGAVGRADMSPAEAREALADSGETALVVLDDSDRYVGVLTLADLLIPDPTPPRPASVGGMATPWGVYLTNGSLQAGVGNGALLGSGAVLGTLLALSYIMVAGGAWALQKGFGWPLYKLWLAEAPAQITLANLGWFILQGASLPLFLLLMRALPLAGYHAAEHQVVHAMERSEPLHPEVVRRMPRVHPRCGPNLMAGALVFSLVSKMLPALHIGLGASDSAVLGAVAALFTWRSVGAFLQQHFTTRPATDRQIAAGIAAARDLDYKYLSTVLRRPTLFRRFWCMGMPQMMIGSTIAATTLLYMSDLLFHQLK